MNIKKHETTVTAFSNNELKDVKSCNPTYLFVVTNMRKESNVYANMINIKYKCINNMIGVLIIVAWLATLLSLMWVEKEQDTDIWVISEKWLR